MLAQPAPQAPQLPQAGMTMNTQGIPANPAASGAAAQTLIKQSSSPPPLPVNPVAAAAYEKAIESTKSMGKTYVCSALTYCSSQ